MGNWGKRKSGQAYKKTPLKREEFIDFPASHKKGKQVTVMAKNVREETKDGRTKLIGTHPTKSYGMHKYGIPTGR